MTDQARAAYVETVLTDEQRLLLARSRAYAAEACGTHMAPCKPFDRACCAEAKLVAIIDQLITHGVECAQIVVYGASAHHWQEQWAEKDRRIEAAEARLTAVRELRDTIRKQWQRVRPGVPTPTLDTQDKWTVEGWLTELDRALDDAPTEGTDNAK